MDLIHRLGAKNDEGKLDRKATKTSRPEPGSRSSGGGEVLCDDVSPGEWRLEPWSLGPWHSTSMAWPWQRQHLDNPYPAIAPRAPRRHNVMTKQPHIFTTRYKVDEAEMSFSTGRPNLSLPHFKSGSPIKAAMRQRPPPPVELNLLV